MSYENDKAVMQGVLDIVQVFNHYSSNKPIGICKMCIKSTKDYIWNKNLF